MSQSRIILPRPSKLLFLGFRRSNHQIHLRILMQNLFDWQLGTQQKPAPPFVYPHSPWVTEWSAPPFGGGGGSETGEGWAQTDGKHKHGKILFRNTSCKRACAILRFLRGQFGILRVPALCEPCKIFAPPPASWVQPTRRVQGNKESAFLYDLAGDRAPARLRPGLAKRSSAPVSTLCRSPRTCTPTGLNHQVPPFYLPPLFHKPRLNLPLPPPPGGDSTFLIPRWRFDKRGALPSPVLPHLRGCRTSSPIIQPEPFCLHS